jgi:anti-sigma B factor antagonist
MNLESGKQGETVVLQVTGRLDTLTAPNFEQECAKWLQDGEKSFLVDLEKLEYISSAGLRSFLTIAKKLKAVQGQISFCNLAGMVQEVFTIAGFDTMFTVYSSVDAALNNS